METIVLTCTNNDRTKEAEVLVNSTKLDSLGETVTPSVQLNSLCINCPASSGSVTQMLYMFKASDLGQLTLI